MEKLSISNIVNIREDVHQGKQDWLDELSSQSLRYINGFVTLIYFNFLQNERKDIWKNLDNLCDIENDEIQEKIINPYYHFVHQKYNTFVFKTYYNQLNRELGKYFVQIRKNFEGYKKYIDKNLNTEIKYKSNKLVVYSPKRGGETGALILDNELILNKILEKIEIFGLSLEDIYEELEGKKASDKVELDIEKYNITPRKYYFHPGTEPVSEISIDEYKKFIFKKFKLPRISSVTIPLDDRFYSNVFEKSGLNSLIDTQLALDKEINNQYFIKIRNPFVKNENIKLPIKYDSFVFNQLKNKYHKKFKLTIDKVGLSIELKSVKVAKNVYKYSQNFRLNSTFNVESNVKDNNLLRLLSYDLGFNNTLSATIVEIDGTQYEDYLKTLPKKVPRKFDIGKNIAKIKSTNLTKPNYTKIKNINFSGETFNKKVAEYEDKIKENYKAKDYNEARKNYKKIFGLQKSWINFIINKLLSEKVDIFIGENLNLTGDKKKNGRNLNNMISKIIYGQFNGYLGYKSKLLKGQLSKIMSEFTSTTCSCCLHNCKENRLNQSEFICINCGHSTNADMNASEMILIYFLNRLALSLT